MVSSHDNYWCNEWAVWLPMSVFTGVWLWQQLMNELYVNERVLYPFITARNEVSEIYTCLWLCSPEGGGRGSLSRGSLCPEGSLSGGLCPGGLCPGGLCPGASLSGGSVQGGLCPGGLRPGGLCPRGLCLVGLCPGGSLSGRRTYPTGMHSCCDCTEATKNVVVAPHVN